MKKIIYFLFVILLIFIVLQFITFKYNGIDISHHNKVDWNSIPDKVEFVYIKATEGSHYKDPMSKEHHAQASKHNMEIGYYHYYRTSVHAEKQLENFSKVLNSCSYQLIPVIDIEDIGNDYTNLEWEKTNIRKLCDLFKLRYGYHPIVYYGEIFDSARKTIDVVADLKKWNRTVYNPFSFIKNPVITQKAIKKLGNCDIDINYCSNIEYITVPNAD